MYVTSRGNKLYDSVLAGCIFSLKMENTFHWQNMNYVSAVILFNISSKLIQVD